jgi:hypothetical protein
MTSLFSTAYLPPISYFSALINADAIVIDMHEHYVKQTYRNRALIYTPNGLHPLIIPVEHKNIYAIPISEVKISYDSPWQKIHWRTITSSYRNSAYFEFFEDELKSCYEKEVEHLFEFNTMLLKKLLEILKLRLQLNFTEWYKKDYGSEISDLRSAFKSKERNVSAPYRQVFLERCGFLSDISILDLICNEGRDAIDYIKKMPNS